MHTDHSDTPTNQRSYQTALTRRVISISFYAGLVFYTCFYAAWFFFASLVHAGDEMGSVDESGNDTYHSTPSRPLSAPEASVYGGATSPQDRQDYVNNQQRMQRDQP